MTDTEVIESFLSSWKYLCEMRDSFIQCVPEDRWEFSHHRKFAPLSKQFKHITKVYGCYVDALKSRKLDMSKKASMFSGSENRENILSHLKRTDKSLEDVLNYLKSTGLCGYSIDLFGMNMNFSEFTDVMIQHDSSHFGIWASYAALGGFETPKSWQTNWKL